MNSLNENFEFIRDLSEFNFLAILGLNIDEYKQYENFKIVWSNRIEDEWYNYVTNIKCENRDEFDDIFQKSIDIFKLKERKLTFQVLPFMGNIYYEKEKYFPNNKFKLVSNEVWQVYDELDKIDTIISECKFNVELKKINDMNLFSKELMNAYKTENKDDPYGDLDISYKDAYLNYKEKKENMKDEFYIVKADEINVGITRGTYNDKFYGIYGIAINEKYRKNGIGKEVIKKQLKLCKEKNLQLAFLQTEENFYPADFYRKIGFKDVCHCYYYTINH